MKTRESARHALLNDIKSGCANGTIRLYFSGGIPPADVTTSLGSALELARGTFQATAFTGPTAGVLVANPVTGDSAADNSGTPDFARFYASDGTTCVAQLTAGGPLSGKEVLCSPVPIVAGEPVLITINPTISMLSTDG